MPEGIRKVNVIGHLHPDTDSVCSAIAYAHLKNEVEHTDIYQPRRAGAINRETAFVLKHFGFAEPELITSVTPQIKDTEIQRQGGIDGEMSLFSAWNLMRETKTDTLCVTDDENNLEGIIAVKDIANANMDVFDTSVIGESHTCYANIIDTLKGEMLLGDPMARVTGGNVCVGTTPEMMEDSVHPGDIVVETVVKEYLEEVKAQGVDTLMLGCTHYPLLREVIGACMGPEVELVDVGAECARWVMGQLSGRDQLAPQDRKGSHRYFVSDSTGDFAALASMFLGEDVTGDVEQIDITVY